MSIPAPAPETIILLDDEQVFTAVVRAIKSGEPSFLARLTQKVFGAGDKVGQTVRSVEKNVGQTFLSVDPSTTPWNHPNAGVREIAPNATGFTQSRRFTINDEIINLLHIKPEDGQLFGWLTLAEFHQRVGIKRLLCLSRALTLREDLHTGDIALVVQASALPYPALYESRPPAWQDDHEAPREPQHYFLSEPGLQLGREIVSRTLERVPQRYIPEIHTGYACHTAWGGGLTPWAAEQFQTLAAQGLETFSEIPVGVYDFATRAPDVPVVCFNIIAGGAKEMAAQNLLQNDGKDPSRYAFYSANNARDAVSVLAEFLRK